MDVVEFRPTPDQLAWTFGGAAPVRRVAPGTVLKLWSQDAFNGVPARDWAVSAAIPFFGGLTSTDRTATLQDPLPGTPRRQPGHPADAGRDDLLPPGERRRCAVLDR